MGTEKFERGDRDNINVGTIGHVDHGKTTLTAAITKVMAEENEDIQFKNYAEIDKSPEEQKRGITISTSHVSYVTAKNHYSHVDCPGHADYVKNMISGAAQMDAAVLVVSATDGVMPQTKEHVLLARQVGVTHLIIFFNKMDVLDEEGQEILELIEMEVRDLLNEHGFDGDTTPFIKGSALGALEGDPKWVEAIKELTKTMDDYIPTPKRETDRDFRMNIEDVFSIEGRGTVVTGRIEQGVIKVGDSVVVVGKGKIITTTCTGVEMFKKLLDNGQAGDNVGVLLRGIKRTEVERGFVLAKPDSVSCYKKFVSKFYFMTKAEGGRNTPVSSGYRPQFYIGTTDFTGCITLPEGVEVAMPGESMDNVEVSMDSPVVIGKGERFAVREGGRTIGSGLVLEVVEE